MRPLSNIPHNIAQKMLSVAKVHEYIGNGIYQNKNFLVARFGSIEGRIVAEIIMRHNYELNENLKIQARNNAGIALPTNSNLKNFSVEYLSAASKADLLGIWNFPDQIALAQFTENKNYCYLSFLDPLLALAQCDCVWTYALKGKRVLVIHPFADTIEKQYSKRSEIKTVSKLLPKFKLLTLKPSVTTERNNKYSWLDELQLTKMKLLRIDFDIAIIGAGAYGLPLAAFVRDIGKKAIHFGGKTQLLFGIIGKRWEHRENMKSIIGEGWVRPSVSETPEYANEIEQGCYW